MKMDGNLSEAMANLKQALDDLKAVISNQLWLIIKGVRDWLSLP